MNLNKLICILIATFIALLIPSICLTNDEERQYFPSNWNIKAAAEKRSQQAGLRYSYSLFSDSLPGKPRVRFHSIDFATQKKKERDWMGLNVSTVNIDDLPWLRIGLGASQEKYVPWEKEKESDFYLTFGYDEQTQLNESFMFEGDMEIRVRVNHMKPYFYVHRAGVYWQKDDLTIGPCLYLRSKTREDFTAIGVLAQYESKNWQIKGEVFQDDVDYRFSLIHHF